MRSFVSVLSHEFGMDSGRVNPAAAGLEIDRFDSWQLSPSSTSGYVPVPSSGLGARRAVAPGILGA
jgi:hypothetical protein